ncbi:hypothetical protein HK102_013794 [Quaeritorhiza haematococci]|nr:hypothetical protein HK102_013794 [Quaeritorhiza haematococci]
MSSPTKKKRLDESEDVVNGSVGKSQKKTKTHHGTTLMWFRTDLRAKDNIAFHKAVESSRSHDRPLIALYVVSPALWKLHDIAPIRVDFWRRNLLALKETLSKLNIPLIVREIPESTSTSSEVTTGDKKGYGGKKQKIEGARGAALAAEVAAVVRDVAVSVSAKDVYWNVEYEVNEMKRDKKAQALLEEQGIKGMGWQDQCIVPPGKVTTKEGRVYTVFTPFRKSWTAFIQKNPSIVALSPLPDRLPYDLPSDVSHYIKSNKYDNIPDIFPAGQLSPEKLKLARERYPAGESEAESRLSTFITNKAAKYKAERDLPAVDGTSALSPYLSAGVISARTCFARARETNKGKIDSGNEGLVTWISELCWRDFYKEILVAFPRVSMGRPFKVDTEKIQWEEDEGDVNFKKWCEGKTGFPIVDAAMRQMNELGWMHNRLRMIAASFLVKHLMLDWRKGERYFMQNLIDGDLSANNGGWQWAASTGTDATPYFRIFNPLLQSEKFDSNGTFIRKWVPELAAAKGGASVVHDPSGKLNRLQFEKLGYPKPIVDHKKARERALERFKAVMGKGAK